MSQDEQLLLRDKGTRSDGWKYETQVMVLLSSHWLNDVKIKDFWMITSPKGIGSFDDIVAILTKEDDTKYVLMGQMKHSDKKMNLKLNKEETKILPNERPSFDIRLDTYLKDYGSITTKNDMSEALKKVLEGIPQENYYYFIFTPMEETKELNKIMLRDHDPAKCLDVKSSGCFQWTRQIPDAYEEFFHKLYFFTSQDNTKTIYKALQESIPGGGFTDPMIDTLCEFIDVGMSDDKSCIRLTRTIFLEKCVEVRLSHGMRVQPIKTRIKEEYFKLWDDIFSEYAAIKIENTDAVLSLIYSYFEYKIKILDSSFSWNDCLSCGQKLNLEVDVGGNKKQNVRHLLDLLRIMASRGEIPWIVKKHHKRFFNDLNASLSTGRFLITFDVPQALRQRKVFCNTEDLKEDQRIIERINAIPVSLQGKCLRPWKEIVGDSINLQRAVQPVHLLKWTSANEQNSRIGGNLEKTDENYIARMFSNVEPILGLHITRNFITEEQFIADLEPRVLTVISSSPGMGKSTTLKSVALKTESTNYVLCWNLAKSMRDIEMKNTNLYNDPLNYLFSKSEKDADDQLVKAIFEDHKDSSRIIVLLDSYDEMLPLYGVSIMGVFDTILKHNIRTVITTRSHAESLIKKRFPCAKIVYLARLRNCDVNDYCEKYNIPQTSNDLEEGPMAYLKFFQIPLHLHMVKFVADSINIHECTYYGLYEAFIRKKLSVYFSNNSMSKNLQINETKNLLKNHTYIALRAVFGKDEIIKENVLSDEDWMEIVDDRIEYETIGIVSSIDGNLVEFSHKTYAEYLAAKWLFENGRKANDFFKQVSEDHAHGEVLNFLAEMKINSWNSSFLSETFVDENNEILNEDEWKLLPLHWGAMNFERYNENGTIFGHLLTRTIKAAPDANAFIEENVNESENLSSDLWLTCACDVKDDNLLENLLKTFRLNPNLKVKLGEHDITMLQYCCVTQYLSKIKILLRYGADPNLSYTKKTTSLHTACFKGNVEMIQLLLDNNGDVNIKNDEGGNALHCSILNDIDVVQFLLQHDMNPNEAIYDGSTALYLACANGKKEVVQLLLDNNADPTLLNRRKLNILHAACTSTGNGELVQLLLQLKLNPNQQNWDGQSSLHIACLKGDKHMVQLLLDNNADPNLVDRKGMNCLQTACSNTTSHAKDIVESLLQHKVNPNQPMKDGRTSLHLACSGENKDIVQLLLENGADPNRPCKWNRRTSLHMACDKGRTAAFHLLLKNGADPNLVDRRGMNSLHIASYKKHFDIVRILLERGMDPNQQTYLGSTPLHLLCSMPDLILKFTRLYMPKTTRSGDIKLLQMLLDFGADPTITANDGLTCFEVALESENEDILEAFSWYIQ